MKQKPAWLIIFLLAAIKLIFPLILQSSAFELQRDEYLYYQQGQHFDLGYLENPPLLSYLGMVSSWFGGSAFTVKFWPCLFGALTLIITCLITAELGGKLFAQALAGLGILTGAYIRVHALFQPNVLDIFFWTLSIYFIIRYFKTSSSKFLYAFAISLALGFWSKYSVIFLIAAIALSFAITSKRKIFFTPQLYKALLIACIIILPNIWWQYAHRWPVIHHMQELQETQLQFLNPLDFIKDQVLYTLPVLFVWIAGLIWFIKNKEYRFLAWAYLLVIVLLIAGRGKSYYSLGIYPMLFAAGSVAWQDWTRKARWLHPVFILLIIALTIPLLPVSLPMWKPEKLAKFYKEKGFAKTGILKWEDQRDHELPQDFADMLGWKELAGKAEKAFDVGLPDTTKTNTIIYCRNYGQAGALKFYGKNKNFRSRVISDNGSFLLWIPDSLNFKHLLFIGHNLPGKDDEVFNHFESNVIMDSVTNPLSRQYGDKIILFRNVDSIGVKLARGGLQEMKRKFKR